MWSWVMWVFIALGAAYALVVLTRYWTWRSNPEVQQYLRLQRGQALSPNVNVQEVVPVPLLEVSRSRAAERRNAILRIFREYQIPVEPGGDQQIRPVPYRFLETPPGYETIRPVFFERNERAAYAEVVRLRWQLESDALLLADRVVDALMIMDQALQTESRSLVKLVRHLDRPRAEETLPWKVVIETDAPERYIQRLGALGDWFGIGVEIVQNHIEIRLLGRCQNGGEIEGLVGGVIATPQGRYGVTCAHVLSKSCSSVVTLAHPSSGKDQDPDIALINENQPCFHMPRNGNLCQAASEQEIESLFLGGRKVVKRHPERRQAHGFPLTRIMTVPVNGMMYRFPHIQIAPNIQPPGWRIWKAYWSGPFSRPGDSGSWVFEDGTNRWVGMVTAGHFYPELSYVAEASPLLEYLEGLLQCFKGQAAPYSW